MGKTLFEKVWDAHVVAQDEGAPAVMTTPRRGKRMEDLQSRFEAALAASKTLSERPDNATLLRLYALFKQASVGEVEGKRPGFSDLVGRAKYDAWERVRGQSSQAAMERYLDIANQQLGRS